MAEMTAGITRAGEGIEGKVWNILGQTYTPKQLCESSFAWHALFPPDTFVPPHYHPTQDEFIYVLDGRLDVRLDGREDHATAAELIRLPRGLAHGIFNRSGKPAQCVFWVSPARRLWDLFNQIHNVPDPDEVVRLAGLHEVHFLPPPPKS